MRPSWVWILGVALIPAAIAQTSHNVTVGAEGSFFDPPTVSATLNDTVNFIFLGPVHSLVQAAWNKPCVPLPGGFNSGIVKRANDSVPPPIWTLTVTNVSDGLWFYCGNTAPVPHCASGMVGAINPPSIDSYRQFLTAAKRVSVPPPAPSLVLTGKGAFATDSAAPSAMSTEATSTFTLDLPTATTTESVLPSNSRPNKRVITGGSIAGVLVLLVFFLFFLLRRRRRQKNEGPDSKDFFRYRAQTPIFGTPASGVEPSFTAAKLVASPTERARQLPLPPSTQAGTPASLVPLRLPPTSATAPTNSGTVRGATRASPAPVARRMPVRTVPQTFTGTTNSAPLPSPRGYPPSLIPPVARPEPTSPPTPAPPLALNTSSLPPRDQKIPLTSSTASTLVPVSELDAVGRGNHNIHVLAQEVAAVLMQTRVHSGTPTGDENSENSLDRTESPAPPKYTRVSVV